MFVVFRDGFAVSVAMQAVLEVFAFLAVGFFLGFIVGQADIRMDCVIHGHINAKGSVYNCILEAK